MPKVSLDIPNELLDDLRLHVGDDKKFVAATATLKRKTVVVRADGVGKPVAVRFGWHHEAEPNLSNKNGLPASPFRTDSW